MKMTGLRPVVAAFAQTMEQKLCDNDHKGGWHDDGEQALLKRLREETDELEAALRRGPGTGVPFGERSAKAVANIGREAADVANFAMMLADVCGAIAARAGGTK